MKRKLSPPPTKPGSVHRRVPADQAIAYTYINTHTYIHTHTHTHVSLDKCSSGRGRPVQLLKYFEYIEYIVLRI